MGLGGIGVTELLVILVIVLLVFGSKKLSGLGKDLGGAIRDFRKSMKEDEANALPPASPPETPLHPNPTTPVRDADKTDKPVG